MLQQEIHQYLENFFEATQCTILENGPGFLTVQLTIEMDKELMNRPFYWTYLEKTGGIPNPGKLTFITDEEKAPENVKGEYIHFGAPVFTNYSIQPKNGSLYPVVRTAKSTSISIRSALSLAECEFENIISFRQETGCVKILRAPFNKRHARRSFS